MQSLRSSPKVAITTAAPTRSGFLLRSPKRVSRKREFPNGYMETFRNFRRIWCEHRSPQRLVTHEKPAICGPFCTKKIIFYESRTGWLGREDSNLRMGESKSPALPLGDAPTASRVSGGMARDTLFEIARSEKRRDHSRADSSWRRRSIEHFPPTGKPGLPPEQPPPGNKTAVSQARIHR